MPAGDRSGTHDVCVVGAGLIGLAVGRALLSRHPGIDLVILDKEPAIARHQSTHNSGVLHSGLYYKPGSLKARLCVAGRTEIEDICNREGIPYLRSGKLVIARDQSELPALEELERRGRANGLSEMERIGPDGIREIEPEATGVAALHVPETGVVDFGALADHLAAEIRSSGASILTDHEVTAIGHASDAMVLDAGANQVRARMMVNCAGLYSDLVARMAGARPEVAIVPFRGEYYQLSPESSHLVKTLIYPVPDPRFPFLGVHFTRRVDGTVEVGPNAVLALGREHYRGAKADLAELRSVVTQPGFLRLATRHWWSGAGELLNSRSKTLYARLARGLVPALSKRHLVPGGAGVRAQAVDRGGRLVDDFVIERVGSSVHILNAPSPGATASLAIGRHVAGQLDDMI